MSGAPPHLRKVVEESDESLIELLDLCRRNREGEVPPGLGIIELVGTDSGRVPIGGVGGEDKRSMNIKKTQREVNSLRL